MTATTTAYLATYLQDHRAAAETASELAGRLAGENQGTAYEGFLVALAQEIEGDVEELEEIMDRCGVAKSAVKTAAAKIGEKLGRLKPNERLTSYSPLSRVLELEGLRAGVQAKLCLWDALAQLAASDERLDAERIAALQGGAQKQLEGLREHHLMATREALVAG